MRALIVVCGVARPRPLWRIVLGRASRANRHACCERGPQRLCRPAAKDEFMKPGSLAPAALVAFLLWLDPASADEAVRLAPHRAVYDLSLARSAGARSVESARGRIAFDFTGDACAGYALNYRQVTVLESSETGSKTSDLRTTSFEDGDGKLLRFRTDSDLQGSKKEPVEGE